jgi:hypothetical protein
VRLVRHQPKFLHVTNDPGPVATSARFVLALRDGDDPRPLAETLASYDTGQLATTLESDEARTAFWCNVYNATVQRTLRERPEVYSRWRFFRRNLLTVAGTSLSLDDIEHGLLRRSQFKFAMGYVRKPDLLVGSFERTLRVTSPDWRIHFALNCGANSCPPVMTYETDSLDEQLDSVTASYLAAETTYDPDEGTVEVTPLFRWYRGDFGGTDGILDILRTYEVIPADADPDVAVGNYDWSRSVGDFHTGPG